MEFTQIPARNFANHIVEGRLEERAGRLRYRVLQVEETVAQAQLCGDKRQRVARRFRSQSRRAGEAGVHLDDTIVFRLRVVGILYVTFAHDADVADDADGQLAELVVVGVGEGLRRRNHDTLAGVDAQRVEVLHVTDRDAVVEAVAHHLVFHFLPALQTLLHQDLRREGEGFFRQHIQLLFVVAEAGTQATEGIRRADNHRIAQFGSSPARIGNILDRLALNRLHLYLVELLDKQLAVFRIHDGLHRCAQYPDVVFLQDTALVERHAAVQRRLPAERQQDTVGTFLGDYFFHEERGNGQEVNRIRHTFGGLHGRDVRVDKDRLDAFLPNRLQRLRAGIVELAGLAYL